MPAGRLEVNPYSHLTSRLPCPRCACTLAGMDILTTEQAAALLQITVRTVKAKAKAGELPARKVGRGWRFSRAALLRHVEGDATVEEVTTTVVRRG